MSFVHQRIEEKTSRKNKRDTSKFSTSHDYMIVQATPVDTCRRIEWVAIGNDSATRVDVSNGWRGSIPNWE